LAAWEDEIQQPAFEEGPETVPVPSTPQAEQELPTGLPEGNGLLEIPKINLRAVVIHGISEDDLKQGPGFYPQSKYPESGNVSIAAHRGVYGSWFRHLDRLKPGDEITLTIDGKIYSYTVRESFITHSRDWSVVDSTDIAELTLTTCLYTTTTKRLIVKADLAGTDVIINPQQYTVE
jgi:sortase A